MCSLRYYPIPDSSLLLLYLQMTPTALDMTLKNQDLKDGRGPWNWGALSVTNHASLGYRNPVYGSFRELTMSFFEDYMDPTGRRTLRSYSVPLNLEVR